MDGFLKSKTATILTVALLCQVGLFYGFSRTEFSPRPKPLTNFAMPNNGWRAIQDVQLDKETLDVLNADDILSRVYENSAGSFADLFIAYFRTQRNGKAPHSPKNCLPGSGWVSSASGTVAVTISGERQPILVNRYIVARGSNQSVVLYWYQSRSRVVASEYSAKVYTVLDAVRFNRTDTALVRVVVAVNNGDTAAAVQTATSFVQAFFEPLKQYLPS
ncbi:MAG: exosortase C-terminal domain/associated protein EpsI [Bryobacteraceae bacterium]